MGWASRWSFSPNSTWNRIETKTIGKTHPTLQMKFIKKLRKGDFEIKMENRSINVPIYSLSETYCTSFYVSMVPKLRPLNWTSSNSHFHRDFLKFCSHCTLREFQTVLLSREISMYWFIRKQLSEFHAQVWLIMQSSCNFKGSSGCWWYEMSDIGGTTLEFMIWSLVDTH